MPEAMLDLLLIASLGFLGSFGHCIGMCGPITVALALSQRSPGSPSRYQQLWFHGLLNLGRVVSYALVGLAIGALGSVVVAGGQMAGVGSDLRRGIAILSGLLLIWFGLVQINPALLPKIPLLNPMAQGNLHERLTQAMTRLSLQQAWWTPLLLGMVWGLIPCGFLYAAQIKAAEAASIGYGSLTMLAFGLGTLPTMLGVGVMSGWLSRDRRSQLFRLGGWITLLIGILTVLRTGDQMVDYTGYGALICLMLALVARPISRLWPFPLRYRRAFGVGAFVLSVAHLVHMLEHSWGWNIQALAFMLPQHQWGVALGVGALALMAPPALTSFDRAQKWLGPYWRRLHLLSIPALLLAALHCLLVGSHYLGRVQFTWVNGMMIGLLAIALVVIFLVRSPQFWSWLSLKEFYVPPISPKSSSGQSHAAKSCKSIH
ncbi:MAG: sulfite exporter TauE/SafE family protein [Synechococcales bacterium]|nr:sulfite exporter TauE/SafE family protein [Synechococcales bacterium]